jgi:serine/threonine-protein kinase
MNIDNFIESQYRRLIIKSDNEYKDLYKAVNHAKLKDIFITLHFTLVGLFNSMNTRLPTGPDMQAHFWADPSRSLIDAIDICENLQRVLINSQFAFNIDEYYRELFIKCKEFLSPGGGSTIPPGMDKVNIYYTIPIFIPQNTITIKQLENNKSFELKLIGEGSYAKVFKYKDDYYQRHFILKRANKDLNSKEIARFKREFEQMQSLNSPYVVEVYRYIDESNEYIMECMDMTIDKYITINNAKLNHNQRKNIGNQILKAFSYIHKKELLHRDISPKNVLIKEYDHVVVVKVSDFGLVRINNSNLTSVNTEFKGYFNDPSLLVEGFDKYSIQHETYALTRLLLFVMTGKTRSDKIDDAKLRLLVNRGINTDITKRFQNTDELINIFKDI